MNHLLANTAISTANANILIGAAKAPHGMPLKMGQHQQGFIIQQMRAYRHMVKPFAPLDRQSAGIILIHNVYWCEIPAIYLQCTAMFLGSIAGTFIIGIGFHDSSIRQPSLH